VGSFYARIRDSEKLGKAILARFKDFLRITGLVDPDERADVINGRGVIIFETRSGSGFLCAVHC